MSQNTDTIKIMSELCQLDIDAVGAYEHALKQIDQQEVYAKIDEFRLDHVQHIEDLSSLIRKHGGTPPERTPDLKGYLIEGYTALRSATGIQGALNAMETNEITTNKTYRQALEKNANLPADVLALLEKNYGDERSHLAYIKEALNMLENATH